jgi:hypothetical protein
MKTRAKENKVDEISPEICMRGPFLPSPDFTHYTRHTGESLKHQQKASDTAASTCVRTSRHLRAAVRADRDCEIFKTQLSVYNSEFFSLNDSRGGLDLCKTTHKYWTQSSLSAHRRWMRLREWDGKICINFHSPSSLGVLGCGDLFRAFNNFHCRRNVISGGTVVFVSFPRRRS